MRMSISINKSSTKFMDVDDEYWNLLIEYLKSYGIKILEERNE